MKARPKPNDQQGNFLYPDLLNQLDPKDPLLLLAKKIPWEKFENEFVQLYAERGRPAKPVRLMVGLLLLKQMENLSDERVVEEWGRNPYFQAFCGMENFQLEFPCEPSDFCHFRKRIGEKGIEKIFQASIEIHGNAAKDSEIIVNTTVQEKNITFPTDTKLRVKVIEKCQKIAKDENIKLSSQGMILSLTFQSGVRVQQRVNLPLIDCSLEKVLEIANEYGSHYAESPVNPHD